MSLSLIPQSEEKARVQDPGVATYSWVEDLYFAYKNPDTTIIIPEDVKHAIIEYLETIEKHSDKRTTKGLQRQKKNAERFAKEMINYDTNQH